MVAVPEERIPVRSAVPADVPGVSGKVARRRVVAVAGSATELLRPRSDLARLLESFEHIDVLLVADERQHGGGVVALPVAGAPPSTRPSGMSSGTTTASTTTTRIPPRCSSGPSRHWVCRTSP